MGQHILICLLEVVLNAMFLIYALKESDDDDKCVLVVLPEL